MKLENLGITVFLGVIAILLLIFWWKAAVAIFILIGWIYLRYFLSGYLGYIFWQAKRKKYEGYAKKKEKLEESADILAFTLSTLIFGALAVWIFFLL